MRLFLTTQKNTVCQHVEPRVGFRTESQTKKSLKALGKQGFCREYFAQIGACGLSCVFLRSCHCCAMERTAGWFPHRKPNKKEPEGSFLLGTPAGNRTRNGPLGGGCYIHLTTEAYLVIPPGILRRCAPRATAGGGLFKRRRSPQIREPLERSLFYNVSRKKATVFEGEV